MHHPLAMCKLHLVTGLRKARCRPWRHICKPAPDSLCPKVGACDPQANLSRFCLKSEDTSPAWDETATSVGIQTFGRELATPSNKHTRFLEGGRVPAHTSVPEPHSSVCHHPYPFPCAYHMCTCVTALCEQNDSLCPRLRYPKVMYSLPSQAS